MVVDGWWWGPGQFRADRCRLRPPPPPGSYRAGRAPAAERPPHGGRRRGEDLSVGRPLGDDVGRTRGGAERGDARQAARRQRPRGACCAGGARGDARLQARSSGRRGGGEGGRRRDRRCARDELGVDELEVLAGLHAGERELEPVHRERLFMKPSISGRVKPCLGRQEPLESAGPQVRKTELCRAAFRVSATSAKPVASLVVDTIC